LIKAGKGKAGKILHMIVRLFFVIMLITGAGMLVYWQFAFLFIVKGVLAIVLIYAMEMLLTRTSKGTIGQQARIYWIVFITCLVLVALIGYNVISF
jgi:predicted tellurium resistance membrane protein TerC